MPDYQSPYNDPTFTVRDNPLWKPKEADVAPAPPAKLSPRAKATLGLGFAAVAAAGLFTWSQYESSQAAAQVRQGQLALDTAKVNLLQAQQAAVLAKAGSQETAAQRARRLAVQACIAKVGGSSGADSVSACGDVFPASTTAGMADAASTASTSNGKGSGPGAAVDVLGLVAIVGALGAGKLKKMRTARS